MCTVSITLNTTTPVGTIITSASGRYRLAGTTTWTNFSINLADPHTPNITQVGTYDLQVNVTNDNGITSEWATSSFQITENCTSSGGGGNGSTPCNYDGNYYHYALEPCDTQYPIIFVKSSTELLIDFSTVYIPSSGGGQARRGLIIAPDCQMRGTLNIIGIGSCD